MTYEENLNLLTLSNNYSQESILWLRFVGHYPDARGVTPTDVDSASRFMDELCLSDHEINVETIYLPPEDPPRYNHMYELDLYREQMLRFMDDNRQLSRSVKCLFAPLIPGLDYKNYFPNVTEIHLITGSAWKGDLQELHRY